MVKIEKYTSEKGKESAVINHSKIFYTLNQMLKGEGLITVIGIANEHYYMISTPNCLINVYCTYKIYFKIFKEVMAFDNISF